MQNLLTTNVSKSYGKIKVLDNISLNCNTGDIIGIFGRNGCGKSTLLKIIFGIVKADSATIYINNIRLMQHNVISQKKIAYLPQEPFLPKGLKVRDVISLFYTGDEQDKIFYSPHIHKISGTRVGSLSMGELRYFELLLIGHLRHPFIMLDEPFSMVEPLYKEHIKELLEELKQSKGIIITDHYYNDVLSISTRNILIKEGKAIAVNYSEDLRKGGYLPS